VTALLFYARIGASLFVLASFLGLALTVALGMAQRRLTARRKRRADRPPVSVIIPIKALDEGFAEAQASVFAQDYPAFDLTITAKETSSPAIEAARAALAAHPATPARIVRSTAGFAASPKVNNLYQAIEDAPHDIIFMKDSNIEIPPGGMAEAVACLDEGVGLVVAVPEAHGAENFAAEIEASIMNQSHGRILAAAAALGLGFGVGKLMVFRRSDLHRATGS
jgi:ceramide glucosyltransferase